MVPVASKPGKPKPPTPPKPVQYQPVNYKRLIDSKYTNNYDSLLDRSLTDDTAPLIEEEAERPLPPPQPPAIPNRIKPPLLPKPLHILPAKKPVIPGAAVNGDVIRRAASAAHQPSTKEKRISTNPFVKNDEDEPEVRTPPSPLRSTNPFENIKEQETTRTVTTKTSVEELFRDLNLLEVLFSSTPTTNGSPCTATQNFDELVASRLSNSHNTTFETSQSSITTSLESCSIFSQVESSNNLHSLEEIHRQFNSDKECLIDRSYSSFNSGKLIRKHVDHQHDRSNRSSWRSNSDLETGDESCSRSSSIHDSSVNGSPIIGGKSKEGADERTPEVADDELVENSSSDNSYSVRRRIKVWFGSFGKGNKASKRRDSKFYVDPESENKNGMMSETTSISSGEEKNDSENANDTTSVEAAEVEINGDCEPFLTEEQKREKKAFFVIKELISSEKVFIDVLKLLTEDFVGYVKSVDRDNPVIPENDLVKIFNYLPQLCTFNEELLRDFESRIENWPLYPKISDIIIKKGPFLKLFSTYIQNLDNQRALLDDCCHKYPRFGKAVKDFEVSERCQMLPLREHMVKPLQRLPQYLLLLKEYISKQTSESIDYEDAKEALRIVSDAVDHANRSVGQGESLSKLLQIQAQLGNYEIIRPGREFVKSGELYKLSRKEPQLRFFILLNDCLLYTSYHGSVYLKVKHKLSLGGMKVNLPQIEDYNNEFDIISTRRSFTLQAKSSDERKAWVSTLETTIKEHNRKQLSFSPMSTLDPPAEPLKIGKEAPIWVPDARVTMCQVCTAEFTVTFRRHHCRACGKVVCSNCSYGKAPLQYMHFCAARVCDDCYQYLFKEFSDPDSQIMTDLTEQADLSENDFATSYNKIISSFKHDPPRSKKLPLPYVPPRLKETPKDSGSICNWLHRKTRKSWKRNWFKLKEQVLFVYKASEDMRALDTIPVLGYKVETFREVCTAYEDIDSKLVFQLAHVNQDPLVFYADTEAIADKWIEALTKSVSMSI